MLIHKQISNIFKDFFCKLFNLIFLQIVELGNTLRDKQIETDRLGQQHERITNDLTMHQDLIQVKDDTIVRLTNQLHEMELQNVMISSVPPSPGGPFSPNATPFSNAKSTPPQVVHKLNMHPKVSALRTSSNGISFDSDKGEFKEFVDVGVQTSEKASMVSKITFVRLFLYRVFQQVWNKL